MNSAENIQRLKRELEIEENNMRYCNHLFDEPIYDAEIVREGYGSIQDGKGSDPHWSFAGYHDIEKDRWSRKCKYCGKKEYTYTQEPVISTFKPKFT